MALEVLRWILPSLVWVFLCVVFLQVWSAGPGSHDDGHSGLSLQG